MIVLYNICFYIVVAGITSSTSDVCTYVLLVHRTPVASCVRHILTLPHPVPRFVVSTIV